MKYLSKDNLIMLSVVPVIIIAATLIVFMPQARQLSACQVQIASEKSALDADDQKAAVVPDMLRQVQEMKSRYKNFDRRLPKQKELGGFLREISANMAQESLDNQLIEPGLNPTREDLFNTLPIIMKFQGSYLSLASFLNRLDKMERLTRVEKLNIALDPTAAAKVNIEMQMNIYFTAS